MREFGKLKTGPGGIRCACCNPRIGKFGRRGKNKAKTATRRYVRRTDNGYQTASLDRDDFKSYFDSETMTE